MFTFSIVVIDIGVPYFVQVIGGGLCLLHKLLGVGWGVAPYAPSYVTYLRLFVVSKCKTFTCGYMQCVCNKCVHIEAQKYTTTFVSSQPCSIHLQQFIYLLLFTRCIVQHCNGYLGIKHYPRITLTFYNCFYWAFIYATNNTLPECLTRLFTHC